MIAATTYLVEQARLRVACCCSALHTVESVYVWSSTVEYGRASAVVSCCSALSAVEYGRDAAVVIVVVVR